MGNTQIKTVPNVDLGRYLGLWYEIARTPVSFEDPRAVNITAEYSLSPDRTIRVVNTQTVDGVRSSAIGYAYPIDTTGSKLQVVFNKFIVGDYWIVQLGNNYEYSVVSNSNGSNLWILSRTKTLPNLSEIVSELAIKGLDVHKLVFTKQN
jgi:apolipoprotein D and lipocalin family protein